METIQAFFDTVAGNAVLLVALLAVVDLGIGVFAAIRDNVFQFDALAAWLRKTLVGRVMPIFGFLLVGYIAGGVSMEDGVGSVISPGGIITGVGLVAATTYVLEVIASIKESTIVKTDTRQVPTD
jgi:small-conductance mechanosensitive channel